MIIINNAYSGDVVIPPSVSYNGTTYPVTSIGYSAFYGCTSLMSVKSFINEPFNVNSLFSYETYRQGTLFVPAGTKDLYMRFYGWREFVNIEEMEEGATPSPNGQCATPTITIIGKKIKLSCETPGATFSSTLTTKEQLTGDELIMESRDITYTLTVVASAEGYDDSAPATVNFTIPSGDLNGDGAVNSADVQRIYSIMATNK